jgi:hypothetical protein
MHLTIAISSFVAALSFTFAACGDDDDGGNADQRERACNVACDKPRSGVRPAAAT